MFSSFKFVSEVIFYLFISDVYFIYGSKGLDEFMLCNFWTCSCASVWEIMVVGIFVLVYVNVLPVFVLNTSIMCTVCKYSAFVCVYARARVCVFVIVCACAKIPCTHSSLVKSLRVSMFADGMCLRVFFWLKNSHIINFWKALELQILLFFSCFLLVFFLLFWTNVLRLLEICSFAIQINKKHDSSISIKKIDFGEFSAFRCVPTEKNWFFSLTARLSKM